jgi:hypothetical protein
MNRNCDCDDLFAFSGLPGHPTGCYANSCHWLRFLYINKCSRNTTHCQSLAIDHSISSQTYRSHGGRMRGVRTEFEILDLTRSSRNSYYSYILRIWLGVDVNINIHNYLIRIRTRVRNCMNHRGLCVLKIQNVPQKIKLKNWRNCKRHQRLEY